VGRSYRDAPEVDGLVLVPGAAGAAPGEMIEVYINGAMEYDLVGELLETQHFASTKASMKASIALI
jgi:ribosomal protein S12 methylthiotransferase